MGRGEIVAIFARDPIFHWAVVLGLTQIGIVSLSIHDNVPAGFRIDAVLSDVAMPTANARRLFVSTIVGSKAMADRPKLIRSMIDMPSRA